MGVVLNTEDKQISYRFELIALLAWLFFVFLFAVAQSLPLGHHYYTGILSLFSEGVLNIACVVFISMSLFKASRRTRHVLCLFLASFLFSTAATIAYNLIINVGYWKHFAVLNEAPVMIPAFFTQIFWMLAWWFIYRVQRRKNQLANIPFIFTALVIIAAFVAYPHWKMSVFSSRGLLDLCQTIIESINIALVINCLLAAKDRRVFLLSVGFLIVLCCDITARFAEVAHSFLMAPFLESFWVLGLLMIVAGFYRGWRGKRIRATWFDLQAWRSLKTQMAYWFFVCFLLGGVLFFIANSLQQGALVHAGLPALLISFAFVSAVISHLLSKYFVRPFEVLERVIYARCFEAQEHPEAVSKTDGIVEFKAIDEVVKEGLKRVATEQESQAVAIEAVLKHTERLRPAVAALSVLAQSSDALKQDEKALMAESCRKIVGHANALLGTFNKDHNPLAPILKQSTDDQEDVYVIVDDSVSLTTVWELEAISAGVTLQTFNMPEEFELHLEDIPLCAKLYFDYNVSPDGAVTGIDLAILAHKKGFTEIYIISGAEVPEAAEYDFIKGVLDKKPPFSVSG